MKTFYKKELKTVMAIFALAFGLLLTNTAQAQTTFFNESETECDTYTWAVTGVTYGVGQSGTYTHTIGTAPNDTVYTLSLTINESNTNGGTEAINACDSYTAPDGTVYTADSLGATATILNVAGCDSVITMNIDISTGTTTGNAFTHTACNSWTTPGGVVLTADTVLIDVATGSNGCPESTTINFVLQGNANTGSASMTECDTLVFGDSTWTTSGTHEYTLTNVDGCDSVVTINLLINTGDENVPMPPENITFCDSVEYGGVWFDGDTAIINTVFIDGGAANTCDRYESTTINLTKDVNNATVHTETISRCADYASPDSLFTTTANWSFTHTSILTGCDSTVTYDYTKVDTNITLTLIESCGAWVDPNGDTLTANNAGHTYSLTDGNGCTTNYTVPVNVNSGTNNTVFWSPTPVCDSYTDPNDPSATAYTTVGPHTYTIVAPAIEPGTVIPNIAPGCDQTVILTLTVTGNADAGSSSVNACDNYTWAGTAHPQVSVDTTLEATFTNVSGCDSVHTLTVNIGSVHTQQFADAAPCTDYTLVNGTVIPWVSGAVVAINDVFTAANGCDSVVTLTITFDVGGNTAGSHTVFGCTSATYGGLTFTADTTFTETLVNAGGCDSTLTVTIDLESATSTSTASINACNSYTAGDGTVYTASATFTDLATNMYGCDSTVLVTLTITNSQNTIDVVECGTEYYAPSGDTLTTAGTHIDTIAGLMGCDSILTINLSFGANTSESTDHSCDGTYNWGGQTLTAGGTYTWTGTNAAGCDSVATLNLTFGTASTIHVETVDAIDEWVGCDGVTYDVSQVVNINCGPNAEGCDSIVTFDITINTLAVSEVLSNVNVYPNPTNGNVTIDLGGLTDVSVKVTNLIGEVIYEDHKISNSTYNLYIEEAAGLYFVEISNENNKEVIKLLVE